ncbi:MAG: ribonuclease D [Flavobacteriales bacterium]|nr:ribonuclease D [Flavobacteriales bacterium]
MAQEVYRTIEDANMLAQATKDLADAPVIALDTEASSFHRFRVRVCLVQLSTRDRTWLVDPLALPDLKPLGDLLGQKSIEVVIHDADYDLRILAQEYGIRVENVFDTLVAAELLNEPEIGLAALLGKYMGIAVDKKFQRPIGANAPCLSPCWNTRLAIHPT